MSEKSSFVLNVDPLGAIEEMNKRKPNFTEAEKFFLVRQYEEYKGILSSRQGDSAANRMKHQVWQLICDELNRRNPSIFRTPAEVRKKWQNLVTLARKEMREAEHRGLPSNHLPWLWRKVVELCAGPLGDMDDDMGSFTQDPESKSHSSSPAAAVVQVQDILHRVVKEEPSCCTREEGGTNGSGDVHNSERPTTGSGFARDVGDSGIFRPSLPVLPCKENGVLGTTEAEENGLDLASSVDSSSRPNSVQPMPLNSAEVSGLSGLQIRPRSQTETGVEQDFDKPSSAKRRHTEKSTDQTPENVSSSWTASVRSSGNTISQERWALEKSQKIQEMKQDEEKHQLSMKKMRIETEILELEREKRQLEIKLLRHQIRKQIENHCENN